MVESIIDYQIAKLDLTSYFDKTYCKTEIKADGEQSYPVHYVGNGNWERIQIDQFNGVAYFRVGESTSSEIDNPLTTDILYQSNFPLKLIAYKRRDSFDDDEYDADGLGNSLKKSLTFRNESLQSTLKARSVKSIVTSVNTDSASIYAEEYNPAPNPDIPFSWVVVSLDIDVEVTHTEGCMDDCPTDTDILHAFNFCNQSTFDRLTDAQKTCLTDELCGTCDDATVQNHDSTPTWSQTIASGSSYTLPQAKMLDSDGSTTVLADYIPNTQGFMFAATPCGGSSIPATINGGADVGYLEALTIGCDEIYSSYNWIFCSQDYPDIHKDATGQNPSGVILNWDGVWDVQLIVQDGSGGVGYATTTVTVVDGLQYHNLINIANSGGGYTGASKLITNDEHFRWNGTDNFVLLANGQLSGDGGFIFKSGTYGTRAFLFTSVQDDPTTRNEHQSTNCLWNAYNMGTSNYLIKDDTSYLSITTTGGQEAKYYKLSRVSGTWTLSKADSPQATSWTLVHTYSVTDSSDLYGNVYLAAGSQSSDSELFMFGSWA